ncbi:hypothetical protein J7J24_02415 [bacterium]|nr:hypothetical protein [bacterium]
MDTSILDGLTSFYIGLICAFSSYWIGRNKKLSLTDSLYASFWFSGALWWIFNGFALSCWKVFPSFARTIIFFGGVWFGIHGILGLVYIARKIYPKRITLFISSLLGTILFFLYYFGFLMRAQEISTRGEVYYNISKAPPHGYFSGGMIFISILGLLFFIFRNLKKEGFTSKNLANFYSLYAFVIYLGIALIGVLYIPAGRLFHIFYLLVAYLVYLGYKDTHPPKEKLA